MSVEVNAQDVINNLLEQNKQLVLEVAILQARLNPSAGNGVQQENES